MADDPCTSKQPRSKRTKKTVIVPKAICEESQWEHLPYPPLVQIYKYLNDDGRSKVSLVCRKWRLAFYDPVLWRKRQFDFGGSKGKASGTKAILFANQHGKFLHDVTLRCRHVTSYTCETITRRLEPFLQKAQRARLKVFRVQCLELDRFWKHAHLRVIIAQCFVNFFESQTSLEVLELTTCQFDLLPGVEVLHAVGRASGASVHHLDLEDFFHSRLDVIQLPFYVNTIKLFTSLAEIVLNYCCINDGIVLHWSEVLAGKLCKLTLKVVQNEPYGHAISNKSWTKLRKSCPQLTVSIYIYDIGPHNVLLPLIPSAIPCTKFRYRSGFDDDNELGLNRIFEHIGVHFGRRLLTLDLDLDNLQDNVNESLITLVTKCEVLKYLNVKAVIGIQAVETICQMLLEGRTKLNHVEIIVREMSFEDSEELMNLRIRMSPLIRALGRELVLKDALFE